MNCYILYCQTLKMDKVCLFLNRRKQVHAYIPQMEKYIASKETMILQVMFPGYVFVETT